MRGRKLLLISLALKWRERGPERGLIDRATEADFEKYLAELEQVWNEREKAARQTTTREFHSWFARYQAKDMKEMLLYPVRRDMG